MGFLDSDGKPFDGAKTYKVTLAKDIPAAAFRFYSPLLGDVTKDCICVN